MIIPEVTLTAVIGTLVLIISPFMTCLYPLLPSLAVWLEDSTMLFYNPVLDVNRRVERLQCS